MHFIQTVESVGCAGSFCYDGDDPEQVTAYQWVIEPYKWYNKNPSVQCDKLVEAIRLIKHRAYPGTSFTRYRIVDGFWDRVIIDWTNL